MKVSVLTKKFKFQLQKWGIRCDNCGAWWMSKVKIEERLEGGTNLGNSLLMDPFNVYMKLRHCTQCNHLMSSNWISQEDAMR